MRALVLTSVEKRHAYFAETILQSFNLVGIIKEKKGNYYSKDENKSPFIRAHFAALKKYSSSWFANSVWPSVPTLELEKGSINNPKIIRWAKEKRADCIFLFGTSILNETWLSSFPQKIINLHLGLSPYYRGSATLFWPIANQRLECVGTTIHLAEKYVDSGRILGQIKPKFEVGDNYYDINLKAIKYSIDAIPKYATKYFNGQLKIHSQDLSVGRVYRKADFNEKALKKALDFIGSGLSNQQIRNIELSDQCVCLS